MSENWIEIPFKDVVKYQKGKKPKRLENEEFEGSIPYLDIKAFEKGEVRRYADVESSNIIDSSSVGVVWDGARSGWVTKGQSGAIGSTIAKLTPIEIDVDYLFWFLESNFHELNSKTKGTGIPHVNPEVIWNLKFPLAPLNEQKRISQQLDAIFEKLNKNKTRLERIPQLLKDFRQTVLQAAVTGELTKEWREEKNCVQSEIKLKGEIARSDLFKNIPKEWKLTNAETTSTKITDGEHQTPKRIDQGEMLLSAKNVRDGYIDYDNHDYISKEDFFRCLKRCEAEPNDVLIVSVGATIGRTAMVRKDTKFALVRSVALIKPNAEIIGNYLMFVIQSETLQNVISELSQGVAQPCLYINKIKILPIPLPPIEEQKEIVSKVEELFAFADAIEQKYEQAKTKIEQLPQSILAKALEVNW